MTKQIETIMALVDEYRNAPTSPQHPSVCRAKQELVAALEAALKPGEPVAWRIHPSDAGVGHEGLYAMTDSQEQVAIWERKGWAIEPLYTAAQPIALKPVEPVHWPAGDAKMHFNLLGDGKAMAKERSREIGDAWNQLADLLALLAKARIAAPPAQTSDALKPVEPVGFRYMYQNFLGDEVWAFEPPRNGKVLRTVPVYTAEPPAQTPVAPRSVTPLQCPKCSALWLFWPKEQTGQEVGSLNLRSTHSCSHCESGGVAQLERLERVQENLTAQTPDALKPGEPSLNYEPVFEFASKHRVSYNELCAVVRSAYAAPPAQTPAKDTRSQFESWAKSYSTLSIDRDSGGAYVDMNQEMLWHAFQAGVKA